MAKKDYQINVVSADAIQQKNNEENNVSNSLSTNTNNNQPELKTGLMIGGLIAFFLAACFLAYTLYFLGSTYSEKDVAKALTFVVFILTIGWISFIPGAICSIVSLCLHPFVIKSSSKKQKIVGIIFTILSILMVLAFFAIAIYIMVLPNN